MEQSKAINKSANFSRAISGVKRNKEALIESSEKNATEIESGVKQEPRESYRYEKIQVLVLINIITFT